MSDVPIYEGPGGEDLRAVRRSLVALLFQHRVTHMHGPCHVECSCGWTTVPSNKPLSRQVNRHLSRVLLDAGWRPTTDGSAS